MALFCVQQNASGFGNSYFILKRSGRKPGGRVPIPPGYLHPGERNALAKSKVHQISRAHGVWVIISLISKYGCLQGVKKAKI
jgi:hypothetical protein